MVKVITGPRRSGKSYLLNPLFLDWLMDHGVDRNRIFMIDLSYDINLLLRNPIRLGERLMEILPKDGQVFLFLDEIQECQSVINPAFEGVRTADGSTPLVTFYDLLNGILSSYKNVEVFVTGSNQEDDLSLWKQCYLFGGLPAVSMIPDLPGKQDYLDSVYRVTYLKDIVDRYSLRGEISLGKLTHYLASVVGSPVNPARISNALRSKEGININVPTIQNYLNHLKDAFLISKVERFNHRGKENFGARSKFYFQDLGLRNAATGFTDYDQEPHYMENIIYNELIGRGYQVSIGKVYSFSKVDGKTKKNDYEVDFVAEKDGKRVYIQSALYIPDEEKMEQERRVLLLLRDGFRKVLITKISGSGLFDEDGILHLNLFRFLKDEKSLQD